MTDPDVPVPADVLALFRELQRRVNEHVAWLEAAAQQHERTVTDTVDVTDSVAAPEVGHAIAAVTARGSGYPVAQGTGHATATVRASGEGYLVTPEGVARARTWLVAVGGAGLVAAEGMAVFEGLLQFAERVLRIVQ